MALEVGPPCFLLSHKQVYMKSWTTWAGKPPQTALHYIKLKEVLNPAGPATKLASLDSAALDV